MAEIWSQLCRLLFFWSFFFFFSSSSSSDSSLSQPVSSLLSVCVMGKIKPDVQKAQELVADKEFEGQGLVARNGRIHCTVCSGPGASTSKGIAPNRKAVRQHCFKEKGKAACLKWKDEPEVEKLKFGHYANLRANEVAGQKRLAAMQLRKEQVEKMGKKDPPAQEQRIARRAEVLRSCGALLFHHQRVHNENPDARKDPNDGEKGSRALQFARGGNAAWKRQEGLQ